MEYTIDLLAKDATIDFAPKTLVGEILQNVRTILSIPKYSVPLDRALGINAESIDKPINEAIQAKYRSEVFTALKIYEPRAQLVSIQFKAEDDILKPFITIKLKEDAI